jgi:hypothetical protein
MVVTAAADWLYPSFLKGLRKINEFKEVIYVELFGRIVKIKVSKITR